MNKPKQPFVSSHATCPPKGSGKFDSRMSLNLSETGSKGSGSMPKTSKGGGKGKKAY